MILEHRFILYKQQFENFKDIKIFLYYIDYMTNHVVSEGQGTAHSFLRDNSSDVQIGDTIEYVSNNQMGYEKYQVICREKGLKLIDDYDSQMNNVVYSDESVGSRSRSRSNSASRKKRARSRSRSSSRSRGGKRNKRKTQRK